MIMALAWRFWLWYGSLLLQPASCHPEILLPRLYFISSSPTSCSIHCSWKISAAANTAAKQPWLVSGLWHWHFIVAVDQYTKEITHKNLICITTQRSQVQSCSVEQANAKLRCSRRSCAPKIEQKSWRFQKHTAHGEKIIISHTRVHVKGKQKTLSTCRTRLTTWRATNWFLAPVRFLSYFLEACLPASRRCAVVHWLDWSRSGSCIAVVSFSSSTSKETKTKAGGGGMSKY